jgi:hypothetical protein
MICAAAQHCAALSSSQLLRQDVLPLSVGYALLMGALAVGLLLVRRSAGGRGAQPPAEQEAAAARPGWRRLARHVLGTYVGGYLLLMAVDIGYYYGVARVSGNFIESAFTGGAMLIGLSVPVFLALSWLSEHRNARQAGTGAAGKSDAHAK